MPPDDFFAFLDASLACIVEEAPDAFRALTRELNSLRARLETDGAARTIMFDYPGWVVDTDCTVFDIEVSFDRQTILDLVDGRHTLFDAIRDERLRLYGTVKSVEQFHSGLMIYLEGLFRSPGVPALLDRYRSASGQPDV